MAKIFISIGSNVDKELNIVNSIKTLKTHFPDLICSAVFESESIGFDGHNFYNLVAGANTDMSLNDVCSLLKQIERDNGRLPSDKKFSPRTLDLDLLFFDDVVCDSPAQLPRDEITKNAFVLWPLADIAAEFIHPINNLPIKNIWQKYDKTQQKLWKVELSFK
jgi:2-amino-4-hydroxy-6-hydroxymethyldihydropteridine diphosphokinase